MHSGVHVKLSSALCYNDVFFRMGQPPLEDLSAYTHSSPDRADLTSDYSTDMKIQCRSHLLTPELSLDECDGHRWLRTKVPTGNHAL